MKIGLMPGAPRDARGLGKLAVSVEAAGFDSLWLGDHVSFPAPILDPLLALACYASHTARVTLGTCVYLLPLRHPTPVAKMTATLDFLCDGRFVFGIGVGGEFPTEFEACGVPLGERGGRANESIEVLRRLWSGSSESFRGRYFDVPAVRIAPAPIRPGGPPIWVGGRSPAALRRAGWLGDGYLGYLLTPEAFRERMSRVRELAAEVGRSATSLTGALLAFSFVDEDRSAAVKRAAGMLGAMYGKNMERAAERYAVVGSADQCRETLARYAEAGVEHVVLSPLAYGAEVEEQIARLQPLLTPEPSHAANR